MCIFTGPVERVAKTCIFARADGGDQILAYQMDFETRQDVAMVLPLPVPQGAGDDALRWIDLSGYPRMFHDIETEYRSYCRSFGEPASAHTLPVVTLGSYDASFVPNTAAFSRLDERYRLGDNIWDQLRCYADFGFAVFKLRPGAGTLHPMAFRFPRRDSARVFFPTMHVHDGTVAATAGFDHCLYVQMASIQRPDSVLRRVRTRLGAVGLGWTWFDAACDIAAYSRADFDRWRVTRGPAAGFMDMAKAGGVIDPMAPIQSLHLHGQLPNRDCVL